MNCPKCGNLVQPHNTQFGLVWQCCNLRSWSEDREMVDEATRGARRAAHRSFDALWKCGKMKRRDAYKRLSEALQIPEEKCHMSLMDKETANKVPNAVRKIICSLRREWRNRVRSSKEEILRREELSQD